MFEPPSIDDGADLWTLARDCQSLDVNSRYAYLLWCRDFAATSIVARDSGRLAGFITGYRRPDRPDTLFVWQVGVAGHMRRQGLARRMLDRLTDRLVPQGVSRLEATVTPDNHPSTRLFTSFAEARGAILARDELFSERMLGEGHASEVLFRISPLSPSSLGPQAPVARRTGRGAAHRRGPRRTAAKGRLPRRLMNVFEEIESEVRSYCRGWPTVFVKANDATVVDEDGKSYTDFFAGAGALNYGHNHPVLKEALLEYLAGNNIVHGLDMYTDAKRQFLKRFRDGILEPRGLDYKVQFPGPAGNNAVEAALKLARKITGRETVISFTNGFHGMTLGALAVTGNSMKRGGAGVPLNHTATMPYDGYMDGQTPDFLWLRSLLEDAGSGLDKPAAVIVETVQGEGGVNVASATWLRGLSQLCTEHGILLIVDDIQMGCGRTGPFFSFERAGIQPDIVTLSKSLSGYGLPLALTLMRPELDVWEPGEHNGTFRGFNPAFATATAAIDTFWSDAVLPETTARKGALIDERLCDLVAEQSDTELSVRGSGMVQALAFADPKLAAASRAEAFSRGLLVEGAGVNDEVVKLLPPLTIADEQLESGLDILAESVRVAIKEAS
ncbi:diaminobutyrate--2-oxoglutarate transaminase [Stackebrandtia sp.]|uniref:diaminobutyrate--2-oxoglutarate transaminase n=1 Tax=Stackebrandtia sp. TaxID=2023065 RepID=UPI0032C21EFB